MPDNNLVFSSQWNRPRGPPLPTWIPRRMSDLRTAIRGVDTAIQELVKPKKLIYSATAAQDTKYIDILNDLAKYRDWVADRHAAWDATGLPEQGENGLAKYNLPDEFLIDKKDWLASLKVLGITTLRVTKDTRNALSSSGVDDWRLSGKARKPVTDLLNDLQ
ncbi:hypothetical protein V8F44DRAFT_637234 [Aspergillus fumigatus]